MKILLLTVLASLSVASCYEYLMYPAPVVDLKKLTNMTPLELDQYAGGLAAEELIRSKRSGFGSGDFFKNIGSSVISGVSQASAGASSSLTHASSKGVYSASGSSSGSSASGSSGGGYDYHPPTTKSPDFFYLKKSILNTLFQAIKAITGGVTILKGQLIKGGGALTSGVGKLISSKGEAVANLGRQLVNSAQLAPPKGHSSVSHDAPVKVVHSIPTAHSSYGPPISSPASSYGPPSGHSSHSSSYTSHITGHSGPSAPSSSYIPPSSQPAGFLDNLLTNPHSTSQSHYPSSHYGTPIKHLVQYEVPTTHDTHIYTTNTIHEGYKKSPDSASHHSYQSSEYHGPYSPSIDTIDDILKNPGYSPTTAISGDHGNSYESNSIYSPPPSYEPRGNSYIPFKSLNIDSYSDVVPSSAHTFAEKSDHGTALTKKLTEMIDQLLGVKKVKRNPTSVPLSVLLYDSKSAAGPYGKPGLNPFKLSIVNDNVDKLQKKLERQDHGRSIEHNDEYEKLTQVLKAIEEGKERERQKKDLLNQYVDLFAKAESSKDYKSNIEKADDNLVQKSLVYELRGNTLVKLTDSKTDSH